MKLELEQFSGPLDLLLSLIQEEKLSISEIAISKVTEQFLAHLDTLEKNRAEELADFLVIASKLLLVKSRLLLPQFSAEDDEGSSLEDQLRLYEMFANAAKRVNRFWMNGKRSVFRVEPPKRSQGFTPPSNLSSASLYARMLDLVARLTPPKPLPETRIDKAISMKQKIDEIRSLLSKIKETSFHSLLSSARNRTEVIVSFLAVLELVKQQAVAVRQEEGFGDIILTKV